MLELIVGTESIEVKDYDLLDIAFSFGFHEIVCPDVPNNPKSSFLRTREFIENWRSNKSLKHLNLMIVPHGNDIQEAITLTGLGVLRRKARRLPSASK